MKIYVPSHERADRCETLRQMPLDRVDVELVIYERELPSYLPWTGSGVKLKVIPESTGVRGLPQKRNWLLNNFHGKQIHIDDDVTFYTRREDMPTRLRKSGEEDMMQMFTTLAAALERYAHVSISARLRNDALPDEPKLFGRYYRVIGYNTALMPRVVNSSLMSCEDMDMNLQLLKMGCPAQIFPQWAHDDTHGTNSRGGCSWYRTNEVQKEAVEALCKLHPKFVTPKWTTVEAGGRFGTRLDPNIKWKAAYEWGQTHCPRCGSGAPKYYRPHCDACSDAED